MNFHVIGEKLIVPVCLAIFETMLDKESKNCISKVQLSKNTISRRINEMTDNNNKVVLEQIKNQKLFSLQIYESTDRSSKAQLLVFGRFVDYSNVVEQFLFCKELKSTTAGMEIFDLVNNFF